MKHVRSLYMILGFFIALTASSRAYASTLYTDLTLFLNDAPSLTTINFEENSSGGFTNYNSGTATFSGVNFTGTGNLFSVDPDFSPDFYEWGSGDVLIDAFGTGAINAQLPGSGATAVGSDIMSFDPEDSNFNITLSTGEVFNNLGTALRPTRTFIGFISDVPITSLLFQVVSGNNPVIDNFRFGAKPIVDDGGDQGNPGGDAPGVPEPSTLLLMGLGLLGFTKMRRPSQS